MKRHFSLFLLILLIMAIWADGVDARTSTSSSRSSSRQSYSRPQTASDRTQSRVSSGESLRGYRSNHEYQSQFSKPASSVPPSGSFASLPKENYASLSQRRTGYYGGMGWSPPAYMYHSRPSFGMWDAMWMWFMFETISNASHAAFFHNHRDDPGYREWRAEADRMSGENAELRQKLDKLDAQLKANEGQPRNSDYLPPDTPPQVALAANSLAEETPSPKKPENQSHFPWLELVILTSIGGAYIFWKNHRKRKLLSGTRDFSMFKKNLFQEQKTSPNRLRPGMVVNYDESLFILADGKISTQKPNSLSGRLSANAIGYFEHGTMTLQRIHVDGGFFQVILDSNNNIGEARWFSLLDEFTPSSQDGLTDGNSWDFWLDEQQGQIGWPAFQTKDGNIYQRLWSPGQHRIPPMEYSEKHVTTNGEKTIKHAMMLYWRETSLPTPAPEFEYILLDLVEENEEAWIAIHTGIDVNPSSLQIA